MLKPVLTTLFLSISCVCFTAPSSYAQSSVNASQTDNAQPSQRVTEKLSDKTSNKLKALRAAEGRIASHCMGAITMLTRSRLEKGTSEADATSLIQADPEYVFWKSKFDMATIDKSPTARYLQLSGSERLILVMRGKNIAENAGVILGTCDMVKTRYDAGMTTETFMMGQYKQTSTIK